MISLCLATGLLLACPQGQGGDGVGEAIYDGRQAGNLPPMRFERAVEAVDAPFGAEAAEDRERIARPDAPRWDIPRRFPDMAPWQRLPLDPGAVFCTGTGVDADGDTPLAVAFDQYVRRLIIWRGDDPFSSDSVAMWRADAGETSVDALGNTPSQKPDLSYSPRSILVLHGTILVECQRNRLDASAGIDWVEEGISLVRVDRGPGGGWVATLLADLASPQDGGVTLGQPRGSVSSMANHYPVSRGRVLRETWIPFVDYQHQVGAGAQGGQLFLLRARRASGASPWQFDGPTLIYEETGPTGRHFHCAGWTPNGIVLSIGDSGQSEVMVLRCADWKRFQDPATWSIERQFHGLANETGTLGSAHQFWGVAPGAAPNELLIGGDNVSSAICRLEVPADAGKRATFRHVWGLPPGDLGDQGNSALTCNEIVRPTPERDGRVLARAFYEGSAGGTGLSRIVWSTDARHFDVVARLPLGLGKNAPVAVLGSWIIAPGLLSGTSIESYAQRFDHAAPATRALRIDPPGTNVAANPAGPLTAMTGGSQVSVTPFLPSDPRYAAFARTLPWNAPIWRVRGAPGHSSALLQAALRTGAWEPGAMNVPVMVANLRSESLRVRAELQGGTDVWGTAFSIVTRDEWFPCTLTTPPHWGESPGNPSLRILQVPAQPDGEIDFLMSVGGVYRGVSPGVPMRMPAMSEATGERWSQAAPAGTRDASVELWIPEVAADSSVVRGLGAPALCSVVTTAGDAVEFRLGSYSRIQAWHWRPDGAGGEDLVSAQVIDDVFAQRGDPIRLVVELQLGGTLVSAVASGLQGDSAAAKWLAEPLSGTISRVVAGDRQGRVALGMAIHRVATSQSPRELRDPDFGERTCPFDLDGDGDQDEADAFLVLYFGGPCADPANCPWDADGSGSVDVLDAILLAQQFAADPCP